MQQNGKRTQKNANRTQKNANIKKIQKNYKKVLTIFLYGVIIKTDKKKKQTNRQKKEPWQKNIKKF